MATGFGYGQFYGLAVTDDGEQVYFTTGHRLKTEIGPKLSTTPAVYRAIRRSVERFTDVPPFVSYRPVSYGNAQTSGDGEVVSYTRTETCVGGNSCYEHPTTYYSALLIRGQPSPTALGGNAQISRNPKPSRVYEIDVRQSENSAGKQRDKVEGKESGSLQP